MQAIVRLCHAFLAAHPDDAARILERVSDTPCGSILTGCEPELAARVIRRMMPSTAAACLATMPPDQSGPIIAALPIDAASLIIRHLAPEMRTQVLDTLPSQTAATLRRVLTYSPGTVGATMDPLAFALPADITVAEAWTRVKDAAHRALYYLYIVDREHKLVGVLSLREFILASTSDQLASIMRTRVTRLKAAMPLAQVASRPDIRRFQSFPVVDDEGRFLGVLSIQALYASDESIDPDRTRRSPLDTIVAFGELYWVVLSGMLSGVQPPKPEDASNSNPIPESTDGH